MLNLFKRVSCVLVLFLSFTFAQGSIYAIDAPDKNTMVTPAKKNILVNGKPFQLNAYNIDNYNYFKLRDIAYVLNGTSKQFEVTWDNTQKAVKLISNLKYTVTGEELSSGNFQPAIAQQTNSRLYFNNTEVQFTTYNINGNNYVKLRDIAALLNVQVGWYSALDMIALSTGDPVVWRIMWLIMPKVEAKLKDNTTFAMNMTDNDIKRVTEMSSRFESNIEKASNNQVDIKLDVFVSKQAVSSLSIAFQNSYYVSYTDMPADAKSAADDYDSVIATVRLSGESCTISTDWWGLGGQMPSNTYCLVQMLPGYDLSWYLEANDNVPYPEEVWIHEWVHCLDTFYDSLGYTMPGSDNSEKYGYKPDTKAGFHGRYKYYNDIFNNKVYDTATGEYIGITQDMWQLHPLMKYH